MEKDYQESYTALDDHWWRRGRRDVVLRLIQAFNIRGSRVLDVGCGSGRLLQDIENLGFEGLGIDVDEQSVSTTSKRGLSSAVGDAAQIGCRESQFDLLVASDVLEHIPDEDVAVEEWSRVLQPGGYALVFVPAFEWLWSSHDDINNHQRRYTRKQLQTALVDGGFDVIWTSYWNIALSPIGIPFKLADRIIQSEEPQIQKTPNLLNRLFFSLLQFENRVIQQRIPIPFGTSVVAVARCPTNS